MYPKLISFLLVVGFPVLVFADDPSVADARTDRDLERSIAVLAELKAAADRDVSAAISEWENRELDVVAEIRVMERNADIPRIVCAPAWDPRILGSLFILFAFLGLLAARYYHLTQVVLSSRFVNVLSDRSRKSVEWIAALILLVAPEIAALVFLCLTVLTTIAPTAVMATEANLGSTQMLDAATISSAKHTTISEMLSSEIELLSELTSHLKTSETNIQTLRLHALIQRFLMFSIGGVFIVLLTVPLLGLRAPKRCPGCNAFFS